MPNNFDKILAETPKEVELFVTRSMDILERLHELLDEKFEGKQKLLAEKLGKTEAEVSKMMSGIQNFTLKTLTKLEAAFGEQIFAVATNSVDFDVVSVKCAPKPGRVHYRVDSKGELTDYFSEVTINDKLITNSQKKDLA